MARRKITAQEPVALPRHEEDYGTRHAILPVREAPIADSRDPNVFRHLLELLRENLLQGLETNSHHAET